MAATYTFLPAINRNADPSGPSNGSTARIIDFFQVRRRLLTEFENAADESGRKQKAGRAAVGRAHGSPATYSRGPADSLEAAFYWLIAAAGIASLLIGVLSAG
jgi:hypothetical protein